MARTLLAVALLFLVGCSSVRMPGWPKPEPETAASAAAWVKPGADTATVAHAYDECRNMADAATGTDFDIDQDIAASRASDLQHSNFAGAQLRDAQRGNRDRAQTILSSCMEKQGFTAAR